MLVRAGFVVVLLPVDVSGFRPVLARGWHDQLWKIGTGPLGSIRVHDPPA